MKKSVFIIEDKLKDMKSFFIFLHELLLNTVNKSSGKPSRPDDITIFFLHVCWDIDDETSKREKQNFDEIVDAVEQRVRYVTNGNAFKIEYHPLKWTSHDYTWEASENRGQDILTTMEGLLPKKPEKVVDLLTNNEPCCAVLMDVILNDTSDKDLQWLSEGHDIPTSWLYRKLTGSRCVVYSEYPPVSILEKWAKIAEMTGNDEEIIQRAYLTRSRAVYIPLRKRLHQILDLEFGSA